MFWLLLGQTERIDAANDLRAYRRNTHLSAAVWGNQQIADRLVMAADRVTKGSRELIETDAEYEGAVRSIENTNLSDEAKAEALVHLKQRYGA